MTPRTFHQTSGLSLRGHLLQDLRSLWASQNPRGFVQNSTDSPLLCGGEGHSPKTPPPLKKERCVVCNGSVSIDRNTHWIEIAVDRVAVLRQSEGAVDTEDCGYRGAFPVGPGCAEQFDGVCFQSPKADRV